MIKSLLQIVLTIILSYFVLQYLPFWAMAVVAGMVSFFFHHNYSIVSFLAGFVAGFLLWTVYTYTLNDENLGQLSGKMGELFQTGGSWLVYISGLIGGLLGGFGALTGTFAIRLFEKKPA